MNLIIDVLHTHTHTRYILEIGGVFFNDCITHNAVLRHMNPVHQSYENTAHPGDVTHWVQEHSTEVSKELLVYNYLF